LCDRKWERFKKKVVVFLRERKRGRIKSKLGQPTAVTPRAREFLDREVILSGKTLIFETVRRIA